jgi:hypothetical protein
MQQTFEYYTVDPGTWGDDKKLDNVKTSTVNRDSTVETLGSATLNVTQSVGESYVRIYLIAIQNGITTKVPLATVLVQTPSSSFNGKIRDVTMDAYTPLIELKENPPPIGFSIPKITKATDEDGNEVIIKANIMDQAFDLTSEQTRAPVVKPSCTEELNNDFVANTEDTWLTFITDLIACAKYKFDLDEMGRILYVPEQDTASLQPVWTYTDGEDSIMYPDLTMDHDLYDVPNVVEVVYTNGGNTYTARVVNDDENSPVSTVNRGREKLRRIVNPDMGGIPSEEQVKQYAEQTLRNLSTLEYTITYTHGYCPVRVGDCVRINYSRAGLTDIKAKVISQSIKCEPGCPVTEKAVFTAKLWG